jgi:hypothetical protein
MRKNMNIYAMPGTKVTFLYPKFGYQTDQQKCRMLLTVGDEYTVRRISVGSTHSTVYFKEIPDVGFNTVMFEDVI